MCGIASIVRIREKLNQIDLGTMALKAIRHRGDSRYQNEWSSTDKVFLGCNRLAFTSKDRAQPCKSANRRYELVLNGEIYDFHGKDESSDTQGLVEHIENFGIESVYALDGIFSVIVVDHDLGLLYFLRDPLGVKPLYFCKTDDYFAVASEIKALASLDCSEIIEHVVPGTIMQFNLNTLELANIASHSYFNLEKRNYPNESSNILYKLLDTEVKRQSSDNHVYGIYLSGGIDSSLIYHFLKKNNRPVIPFVLGNRDSEDKRYASALTKQYGDSLVTIECPPEKELFHNLKDVIYFSESFEPNVVKQSSVNWILSREAKKHGITAVFCGEGADELFGGYPEFEKFDRFVQIRNCFLRDLHKTQLQRVDKINMAFTIEVRVPFLSPSIVKYALASNQRQEFVRRNASQRLVTKLPLREVALLCLPKAIANRPKVVFSEGAGMGSNDNHSGLFSELVTRLLPNSEFIEITSKFREWNLRTKEEALYFKIFHSFGYSKYLQSKDRVFANRTNTISTTEVEIHPKKILCIA